jgi:hypothetical protein
MTTFYSFQKQINKSLEDSSIDKEIRNDFLLISLYFAQLAYFSPTYISTQLSSMGAIANSVYSKQGVQAFFAEFDTFAVISFKGREVDKWKELKADIRAWKTKYKGFNVHCGFSETLEKVSNRLLLDLAEVTPGKRLLYTGHSLGGALAIIMALLYQPSDICTFGSPRAVNASEVNDILKDVNITRVHATNDYVCNVPPEFMGYKHLGESLCINGLIHSWESHRLRTYLQGVVGNHIEIDDDNIKMAERLSNFLLNKREDSNDNEAQV